MHYINPALCVILVSVLEFTLIMSEFNPVIMPLLVARCPRIHQLCTLNWHALPEEVFNLGLTRKHYTYVPKSSGSI